MELDAVQSPVTGQVVQPSVTGQLAAGDFLQLLVTQLTNQDPLAPASNEALLAQLSSIREIELSSTLSDSLKTLARNQRYGAAAGLIGKFVTGRLDGASGGGEPLSGEVIGIRFSPAGEVTLLLDTGDKLSLEQLETVQGSEPAAEALIGRLVRGYDRADPENEFIEGIVVAVRRDEGKGVLLELDTGEQLPMGDLIVTV